MFKDFLYSLLFSIVFLFSTSVYAEKNAGFGTYSEGFRMGMITKFSIKGLINKSGEGQMLMGREGTPYSIKMDKNTKIVVNPWYFSADKKDSELITKFVGEYVWVQYQQAHIKSLSYDTEYMVVDIQKPTKKEIKSCVEENSEKGSKSNGVRVGRIVKISKKGIVKSYEMIMQIGNAGDQFKNMTVKSKKMYDCAVSVLKSAKRVRITYSQTFFKNPFTSDTTYTVVKIEPISDI